MSFGSFGHVTAAEAYPFWLVCVPVVAIGAPFGAWVASRIPRQALLIFVLFLIILEAVTTTVILGWNLKTSLLALVVGVLTAVYFAGMIRHRNLATT